VISRTAEYAVRAALWLAAHADETHAVRQVARATGVPAGYLAKILQALGRAGLVRAQPGPGGGFQLHRPAERITVLDVIHAVDPVRRISDCPLGDSEHRGCLCPFHARLEEALAGIERVFADCTLAELLAESHISGQFCSRPMENTVLSQRSK
jgi:Rrf2 family protein